MKREELTADRKAVFCVDCKQWECIQCREAIDVETTTMTASHCEFGCVDEGASS
jgi:hypothetical protein